MRIEILKEGNRKRIRFIGRTMIEEVVLDDNDVERLSEALASEINTSLNISENHAFDIEDYS